MKPGIIFFQSCSGVWLPKFCVTWHPVDQASAPRHLIFPPQWTSPHHPCQTEIWSGLFHAHETSLPSLSCEYLLLSTSSSCKVGKLSDMLQQGGCTQPQQQWHQLPGKDKETYSGKPLASQKPDSSSKSWWVITAANISKAGSRGKPAVTRSKRGRKISRD